MITLSVGRSQSMHITHSLMHPFLHGADRQQRSVEWLFTARHQFCYVILPAEPGYRSGTYSNHRANFRTARSTLAWVRSCQGRLAHRTTPATRIERQSKKIIKNVFLFVSFLELVTDNGSKIPQSFRRIKFKILFKQFPSRQSNFKEEGSGSLSQSFTTRRHVGDLGDVDISRQPAKHSDISKCANCAHVVLRVVCEFEWNGVRYMLTRCDRHNIKIFGTKFLEQNFAIKILTEIIMNFPCYEIYTHTW